LVSSYRCISRKLPEAYRASTFSRCTQIVQRSLAKQVRIALAGFRKLDDFVGDYLIWICQVKSRPRHFECDAHDPLGLKIELVVVKE
jgi:hypothetical protein